MQIIGFNFERILAERKNPPKEKIQVKSNINIISIEQEKLDLVKSQETLKFNFEFAVDYTEMADISLKGFVLMLLEKEKAKDVLAKWKKKKILDEVRIPLFNFILTKCNIRALQLEEELGLPSHVPLPRISQQQTSYTG